MPMLDSNSPQVAHLMQRNWRLGRLIQAVGPLTYSVEGSAYEHLARELDRHCFPADVSAISSTSPWHTQR